MKADLHCHTMLSDGTLGIEELIQVAKKSGIDTIAITDHDTLAATVRGKIIGKRYNIEVIPGVELSCWDAEHEKKVHLICYLPDSPDRLEGLCRRTSLARNRAGRLMVIKATAKYPITTEFIAKCGQGSTNIYKQHIMRALVYTGYADSVYGKVFHELFTEKGEKNISVPVKYPDVHDVLKEILGAGGIAVLAHPCLYGNEDVLDELVDEGLCGIEAYHPSADEEQSKRLVSYAKKHKLLVTGGSDFHGYVAQGRHAKLGDYVTPEENLNALLGYKAKMKRQKRKEERLAASEE